MDQKQKQIYEDDHTVLDDFEVLKLDLKILLFLKQQILDDNLEYVEIADFVTPEILIEFKCDMDYIVGRIFYNLGLGYIDVNEVTDDDIFSVEQKCIRFGVSPRKVLKGKKGDKAVKRDEYYRYFLEAKLTSNGRKRIHEIMAELKEQSFIGRAKEMIIIGVKKLGGVQSIVASVLSIFILILIIYNLQLMNILKGIPLTGSLLDSNSTKTYIQGKEVESEYFQVFKNSILHDYGEFPINSSGISEINVRSLGENKQEFRLTLRKEGDKYYTIIKDQGIYIVLDNESTYFKNYHIYEEFKKNVIEGLGTRKF